MADGFDVQAHREALLRPRKIDHRGSKDAVEHRIGMFQRSSEPGETVQHLLLQMKRGEERALAPQNVDVAAKSGRCVVGPDVEVHSQCIEFLSIERPRIALRREDRRPRSVQRPQSVHQRRVTARLRADGRDRTDSRAGR